MCCCREACVFLHVCDIAWSCIIVSKSPRQHHAICKLRASRVFQMMWKASLYTKAPPRKL